MPVGTKATVKAVSPRDLGELGARIVLANTYHLYFRPGTEIVAAHGGLHGFMRLGRPDPHRLGRLPGVQPRGHARHPRRRRRVQPRSTTARGTCSRPSWRCASRRSSGPTSSWPSTSARRARWRAAEIEAAVERTTRWAAACKAAHERPDQLLVGIVQGGVDEALRRRSAAEIMGVGFDAYAIGGLSVGERGDEMLARSSSWTTCSRAIACATSWASATRAGIVEVIAPRRGRLRLRAADAPGAHRDGVLDARAASTCATRASPPTWRRSTRPATATRAARSRARTCATS